MAKQPEKKSEAELKPMAVTYACAWVNGVWRAWRLDVYAGEDGKPRVESTEVVRHTERLVARERLLTLLMSKEVLP